MPVQTRNDCPSPRGIGTAWTSTGTSGGLITRGVSVSGMDVATACRHQQGGVTGNARVQSPAREFAADIGGQQWTGLIQGEPEPAPTRYTGDPVCATSTTGWRSAGGSGARVTGLAGMVATTGYRVTASPAGAIGFGNEIVAVTAGENVTGTVQARPSVATNLTWYLSFYDSGGALVSRITGPVVAAAAGAAITRAVGAVAPAGAVTASVTVYTDAVASGSTLIGTGARFDGVADATDMAYAGTVSCSIELVFRDAAGAALSTITSTEQVVATGTPVRCRATGTAPSGTRRVQATFLGRAVAAGALVHATAARLAAGDDSAMAYLDGETSGWLWDGTRYESTSGQPVAVTAPTESGTGSDAAAITATLTGPTDTGTLTDSLGSITATVPPRVDTATGTDTATTSVALAATEQGAGTDTARVTTTHAVLEQGTGTDTATSRATPLSADVGVGSDAVAVSSLSVALDGGTGSDSVTVTASVGVVDTATGTDTAAQGEAEARRDVADQGAGSDSVTVSATVTRVETGTGTDSTTLRTVDARDATDTATGTDTATIAATVARSDAGTGSDAAAITAVSTGATEQGAGTDSVSVARTSTVLEPGAGTDSAVVAATTAPPADAGTGSDSARIAAAATALEQGTGTDAAGVSATVARVDGGTGTDTAAIVDATITRSDAGTGSDSVTVAAASSAADDATGLDDATLTASVTADDSGAGADAAVLEAAAAIVDQATGADDARDLRADLDPVTDTGAGDDAAALVAVGVDLVDDGGALEVAVVTAVIPAQGGMVDIATGRDDVTVTVDAVLHPVRASGLRADGHARAGAPRPDARPRSTPRPTSS